MSATKKHRMDDRETSGSLFPVSRESFAQLPEDKQLLVFCELMDQCTPQMKLHLHEKLKDHLTRDFVTLLPLEVVVQILSYVGVEDLVAGLQVCRSWRLRISLATSVWKAAAETIGLSNYVVSGRMPKYGSMMSLTMAALKHRRAISSSVAKMVAVPGDLNDDHEYRWAGNGVVYSSWRSRLTVSMEVMVMSDIHSQLSISRRHSSPLNLPEHLVPAWATAVGQEYIIWRNKNHDSWVKCGLDEEEPNFQIWRDNSDRHPHLACVCDTCGLIVIFPTDVGQPMFRVTVTKLLRRKRVEKIYHQLAIPQSLDMTTVSEVDIFPGRKEMNFCSFHHALVRFQRGNKSGDCVITDYHIPTHTTAAAATTINPAQILRPRGNPDNLSFFQRSADGKLISMVETRTCNHHIWSLDTGIYHIIRGPPNGTSCLALGHLYSVLQCENVRQYENSVKVVSTYTGQVLLSCFIHFPGIFISNPDMTNLPYPRFWEPLDSGWLNDFECYQKGQWHIVAVNTGLAGATKLSSVVGLQVHKS